MFHPQTYFSAYCNQCSFDITLCDVIVMAFSPSHIETNSRHTCIIREFTETVNTNCDSEMGEQKKKKKTSTYPLSEMSQT